MQENQLIINFIFVAFHLETTTTSRFVSLFAIDSLFSYSLSLTIVRGSVFVTSISAETHYIWADNITSKKILILKAETKVISYLQNLGFRVFCNIHCALQYREASYQTILQIGGGSLLIVWFFHQTSNIQAGQEPEHLKQGLCPSPPATHMTQHENKTKSRVHSG